MVALLAGLLAVVSSPRASARSESRTCVAVSDADDLPIRGLTTLDFAVQVDGETVPVLRVQPATEPLALAVVVTTARNDILPVREALKDVAEDVRGQNPESRVGLTRPDDFGVSFDGVATGADALISAFNRQLSSPVDLVPGIVGSAHALGSERADRRAVLAITTLLKLVPGPGAPAEGPALEFAKTLRRSRSALWVVNVENPNGAASGGAEEMVGAMAKASGGRMGSVIDTTALVPLTRRTLAVLLAEYVVTFAVPDHPGPGPFASACRATRRP
jgi:hypothetical protein